LRNADYGYISRTAAVMDGPASDLASNEDVKEFYLGLSTSDARASAIRNITVAAKRWLA